MTGYIWQLTDWEQRLRWNAEQCLAPLAEVRRAQGRLLGKAEGLGIELGRELQIAALVDEAVTTSAIEGETLDRDSVRSSVVRRLGVPSAGLSQPQRRVDGLVELLVDATAHASAPLTEERLKGWHAALFPTGHSGIRRIVVGDWRAGPEPMQVVSGRPGRETVHFEAPPADRVPGEIGRFLSWWVHGGPPDDGILRAGLAHLWLVTIHPFEDGNGRIARAVADMALARDEGTPTRLWSLSPQIQAERARYYEELQRAQHGDGEITPWLLWFTRCVHGAIAYADGELDKVLAKAHFWQKQGGVSLNERQVKVMNRLLDAGPGGFEGGLTTRKYVAMTRTSRATAQREIAVLVSKGLLARRPGGGRSTSYEVSW